MIRFRLQERIADKAFNEKRRITIDEVARETGIGRATLSRLINVPGYCAKTSVLDTLCKYFACGIEDLAEYVPDVGQGKR